MIILTTDTQGFGTQHHSVGRQTVFVAVAVDGQILFRLGNGVCGLQPDPDAQFGDGIVLTVELLRGLVRPESGFFGQFHETGALARRK